MPISQGAVQSLVNLAISFTPLFSYGLTSYQIYLKKTTSGFSIDVCLIMLISSICKVIYYMLEPYEISLFRQALIMIFIQVVLLKTCLRYLETPAKLYDAEKIIHSSSSPLEIVFNRLKYFDNFYKRPYNFWQWYQDHIVYWEFLVGFSLSLTVLALVFQSSSVFISTIGFLGLFSESLLPLPQILLIHRMKSVKNFKWILLLSWLGGDFVKINYLLFGTNEVSSIFMSAALFQTALDVFIVSQYFYYKNLESLLPQ
ncbi:hypothetical protein CANTEDRAFT_105821 [Yamadazyma tenuis ATCC 10573]|uniref:PQ-loop-domain-containing protein n=2 Tax=Candida tenuis TaxID=2315449 RepID=G3B4C7_CANTC|nr:uncharacterized protein CANTEDRAFT_105821 [Yamadazyma tenuis ATCC 10573]EGV63951.1 hypothetical protein CANTEDRAFT_105821 [Yamadazyma tenuis ATCC 10573]